MLAHELLELSFRLRRVSPLPMRVDDSVFGQPSRFIEDGNLAPGPNTRIDGQHLLAAERWLQKQAAEVLRKDVDGVVLRPFGEFTPDFALEGGQHQPLE